MTDSEFSPDDQDLNVRLEGEVYQLRDKLTNLSIALKDLQFELQFHEQVSEVIGTSLPQIAPKKHLASCDALWQGGARHWRRPQ